LVSCRSFIRCKCRGQELSVLTPPKQTLPAGGAMPVHHAEQHGAIHTNKHETLLYQLAVVFTSRELICYRSHGKLRHDRPCRRGICTAGGCMGVRAEAPASVWQNTISWRMAEWGAERQTLFPGRQNTLRGKRLAWSYFRTSARTLAVLSLFMLRTPSTGQRIFLAICVP